MRKYEGMKYVDVTVINRSEGRVRIKAERSSIKSFFIRLFFAVILVAVLYAGSSSGVEHIKSVSDKIIEIVKSDITE